MDRKPNCNYQTGPSTEISAKYNDFCTKVNNVLLTQALPDKHNVGFKTCGTSDGYWRIQRDRRIGPNNGNLQIAASQNVCSACFGFLNKALLLTKNHTRYNPVDSPLPLPLPITASASTTVEDDEEDLPENFTCIIPDSFKCPINRSLMRNPVICTDGHSYEKSAIQKWLKKSDKSPLTNLVLEKKLYITSNVTLESIILIPNHSLRKSIQEFIEQNTKSDSDSS